MTAPVEMRPGEGEEGLVAGVVFSLYPTGACPAMGELSEPVAPSDRFYQDQETVQLWWSRRLGVEQDGGIDPTSDAPTRVRWLERLPMPEQARLINAMIAAGAAGAAGCPRAPG